MKVKILASGSKGNSTLIKSSSDMFLIDIGISTLKLKRILEDEGLNVGDLSGVFISHCHSDHISGLLSLVKKYKIKVYVTDRVYLDIKKYVAFDDVVLVNDFCQIGDLTIKLINTSHDVSSNGYVVFDGSSSLVYITDTGYINKKYFDLLSNRTMYIIESNHNEEMLLNGPYPFELKKRVLSDKGHLSNGYTGRLLAKLIGNNTKRVILAHISENNNTYELAYDEVKKELDLVGIDLVNKVSLDVAKQNEVKDFIEV